MSVLHHSCLCALDRFRRRSSTRSWSTDAKRGIPSSGSPIDTDTQHYWKWLCCRKRYQLYSSFYLLRCQRHQQGISEHVGPWGPGQSHLRWRLRHVFRGRADERLTNVQRFTRAVLCGGAVGWLLAREIRHLLAKTDGQIIEVAFKTGSIPLTGRWFCEKCLGFIFHDWENARSQGRENQVHGDQGCVRGQAVGLVWKPQPSVRRLEQFYVIIFTECSRVSLKC